MRLIFYRTPSFELSKKSLAPSQGQQGFYYALYNVTAVHFILSLCPVGRFRAAGLFCCSLKICLLQKFFREIFKKAGRIGCFRCHISGKGKIHPTSPRKGGEKMEAIPRNDGEQYRFDAFCKAVLRNEARNYHRNKKRLLDREKSFSVLSLEELGQLTSVDHIARFTLSEVLSVRHFRWQSMMIGYTKIHLNFSLPQSL